MAQEVDPHLEQVREQERYDELSYDVISKATKEARALGLDRVGESVHIQRRLQEANLVPPCNLDEMEDELRQLGDQRKRNSGRNPYTF